VLELTPNTLGAAAYVALSRSPEGCHASLPLLAIHPALAKCAIEDRLAREVIALCDRIGVVDLDVTCEPTHPTRRAS
jgi:hypothetical protein